MLPEFRAPNSLPGWAFVAGKLEKYAFDRFPRF
jgi:hypothetical protein